MVQPQVAAAMSRALVVQPQVAPAMSPLASKVAPLCPRGAKAGAREAAQAAVEAAARGHHEALGARLRHATELVAAETQAGEASASLGRCASPQTPL